MRGNTFGGVTAAIVALPLALAFGISSGIGPAAGLYGAVIVGFFAAIFGGTPAQISGPTGPMTVVMTAMTAQLLAIYPEDGLALAFTTVFLGGVIQMLMGALRLGKYIIMVPYPVISGFMTGIGVIIILLQLGPFMGFASLGSVLEAITALPEQLSGFNATAATIGTLTLGILFAWRGRISQLIPAPLLALVVATITLETLWPGSDIGRIGSLPASLPSFHLPDFRLELARVMLTNGLMLAVLGSIDSLLTSLVADNMSGVQHDSDRELIGQGLGNSIAGLFGGLPGAGATMRTVVNIRAGGDGPLSGVTHALILFAVLAGFGFIFENIPLAALAGILVKVGLDIIDWPFIRRLHRIPVFPVALMLTVLLLTVFVDLITAVFVGVFVKNLVTISNLSDLQLGSVIISDGEKDCERLPIAEANILKKYCPEVVLVRLTGPLSYAVGRGLTERFRKIKDAKHLLIDLEDASIIGISTALVIEQLVENALANGIDVKLIDKRGSERLELKQLGLIELVGHQNRVDNVVAAVQGIKVSGETT